MNDQINEQRQKLAEAFGKLRAERDRLSRGRRRLRGRAVEQHDSLNDVLRDVSRIRETDGQDILTHRAHLGLLDEQERLQELLGESHSHGNLQADE